MHERCGFGIDRRDTHPFHFPSVVGDRAHVPHRLLLDELERLAEVDVLGFAARLELVEHLADGGDVRVEVDLDLEERKKPMLGLRDC